MAKYKMWHFSIVSCVLVTWVASTAGKSHHSQTATTQSFAAKQYTTGAIAAPSTDTLSTKKPDDPTKSGSSNSQPTHVGTINTPSMLSTTGQLSSTDQTALNETSLTEPTMNVQSTTNGDLSPTSMTMSSNTTQVGNFSASAHASTIPGNSSTESVQTSSSQNINTTSEETSAHESTKPTTLIGAPNQPPNQPPTQTSGTISQPTSPTLSELLSALEQFNKPNSTVLNETNPQPNSEGQLPHKPILLQNITTLGDLIRTMSDLNLTNFDELRQLASPSDDQLLNRLFDVTDGLNVTTIDALIALTTRLGIYFENSTGIEDIIGSLELINTGASASNVTGNPVAGDNTNISETMTTTDEYSRMETVSNDVWSATSEPTIMENTTSPIASTTTTKSETTTSTTLPETNLTTTTLNPEQITTEYPLKANTTVVYTNQNRTNAHVHMINYGDPEFGALVAALIFGCLFLVIVVIFIGKRFYDGYQRRHYTKLDYLVNGMYN